MTLPARVGADGAFPFGQPNGPRPWRWGAPGLPDHLVIGVYPSALHVRWEAPAFAKDHRGPRGVVGSMAIDVEPQVFWNGKDAETRINSWKSDVGFVEGDQEGCHGHIEPATNGPTGDALFAEYLPKLGWTEADTALLDVYPVYLVKRGSDSQRGQGRAIEEEYDPLAGHLSRASGGTFQASNLPERPTAKQLPKMAAERFGAWLVEALTELRPSAVITLGQEPWDTLELLPGVEVSAPAADLSALLPNNYGQAGRIVVDHQVVEWTPLAHPGLIRQDTGRWAAAHGRWIGTEA